MLSKFFFIRHGQLVPPYLNHLKMDYDTLADLSIGKLDPGLNANVLDVFTKQCSGIDFSKLSVIYYNSSGKSSRRSIESAKFIADQLKKEGIFVELRGLPEMHEVDFDVRQLLTIKHFKTAGMPAIRTALYYASINGGGAENINSIASRIQVVQNTILDHSKKDESVLFVTHDFFMRFLEAFIKRDNRLENISADDLDKTSLNYYFGGFETDSEVRGFVRWGEPIS